MAWDRDDTEWAMKLLLVTFGWWSSIVCASFMLFRHIPVFTMALCIVLLICFVFYWGPIDVGKQWARRKDKIALFFTLGYMAFMLYLAISFMNTLNTYYITGVLPEYYTDIHWPNKWYAPLIYVGAAMCPVIYGAIWLNRTKGG
jgi:drug/metabolite transporter (DMT)-like permease